MSNPRPLAELLDEWRAEALHLRARYGAESLATLCEAHASDLETAMSADAAELLTLGEAAAASGYSRSHLRALLAAGTLTNAGRKGAPRLVRGELPAKRQAAPQAKTRRGAVAFDAAGVAARALRGSPT